MTAEINRRVNEAVNASIRPLQDQMTQLLTALNGLMSTDRATPTPLTSSVPTPSTADTTIQAISDGITIATEGRKKPLLNPPKFTGRRKDYAAWAQQMRDKIELDARYISSNADIWYFINSCLDSGPQQVVATFYAAGGPGGQKDSVEFLKYLDRTRKPLSPTKAKKVKKVKKDPKPEGSNRSEQVLGSFSDIIGATKATGVVVFNLELCGYDEKIFAYTKALTRKTEKADLKALLPPAVLAEFQELFQPDEAANLPPHRPGVNHTIPIKQESNGNEAALPWGPLYSMSREELLILRKTLRDLLDKGFICASSSEASALVLFRIRSDLAMDFITNLPLTDKGEGYLWVIIDRLGKGVTLEAIESMEAEACAERFLSCHFRFHGVPTSIANNLPAAQLALCSRDSSAIGMSSFFLEHRYHPEPVRVQETDPEDHEGPREDLARKLVTRLQDVMDIARSTLASTQQRYEELANRKRQPTERLEAGDKVWLHIGHYRSPRLCKKLD
ncbi:hypothetical protein CGCA056_v007737 [Colletotrichum aenigma]|uniref:uncharacterized protein n=1 Tax=Colletotrichum aenigma TaxID=1215731 RepID=UPI00187268BE|nr:uncharacterized protein CGCA056_v007737 [Colletotrichum aenigma]KAF5520608.1 hypothetical protein CGCA056_v007737 [Colletotrichum aenigma]